MFPICKCEYCKDKDGKKKNVYETFQAAFDTAKYIEEKRDIYLSVYPCPHGNGWHLTKNNAPSKIIDRSEMLLQDNNIPLESPDGSWVYIKDSAREIDEEEEAVYRRYYGDSCNTTTGAQNVSKTKPIIKMECKPDAIIKELSGKIMELIKDVNIEKIFKINLQNVFCAGMVKNILEGTINQITIYVENNSQLESYTILLMDTILQANKIVKGAEITVSLIGKSINGIAMWCCAKLLP
jgi:hypothetical protein